MRLKLNYSRPDGTHADLHVTVDADTTVGQLADRVARSDPNGSTRTGSTIVAGSSGGPLTLDRRVAVVESGLQSGSSIALGQPQQVAGGSVAAVLTVHSGPDAGRTFELNIGSNTIGRGRQSTVRLSDPMVSTLHARIVIGDAVEIIDENSSNGIVMGGEQVSRVELRPDEQVLLGDSYVSVRPRFERVSGARGATVEFNRSPRVDPTYEGIELTAPEPPEPVRKQPFPLIAMLMPLLMVVALVTIMPERGGQMFVFMLFSPLMMFGAWWQTKRSSAAEFETAVEVFRANLADLMTRASAAQDEERNRRCIEHPGTADSVEAIRRRSVLLWTRRPEHERFMQLRLGLGVQASRVEIDVTKSRKAPPELVHELESVTSPFVAIDRVPIVGAFDVAGSIGVAGAGDSMRSVARGVVLQLAGLHSPAEVVICAMSSLGSAPHWEWLKWLPHTISDQSPIDSPLAASPPACANLAAQLGDIIDERSDREGGGADSSVPLPRIVLLVEDDASIDRNRLVQLAETGPAVGVHLIWVAASTPQIPAACRSYIEVEPTQGAGIVGRVVEGELSYPVLLEPVSLGDADALARSLSPVVDAGALAEHQSDLPNTVSFLADAGLELAESADAVIDRWRESLSVFPPAEFPVGVQRPRSKRPNTLRGLVGRGAGDNVYLDLRTQGPHALVGGTTGSGKSEFLQSWIMGMATAHGPQRVTFLFVDYKGGAAFADCVQLPHCVGLVTDLSPRLVRRALTSLRAELRFREHLLNRHGAKDLAELEATGNPETPPSLVIIVDEFAALVQEVPEFVDGVVDVAQRGRSLGLHLILATQRPAGVIKDNLRANTNLRVALRVNDADDSRDVIGTTVAADFDPSLPGRGIARTGPGRLTPFQAGYVGGWTRREAPEPTISIETFGFGASMEWELPEDPNAVSNADEGPNDIERMTSRVIEAAQSAQLPEPRRPWLPELSRTYDLGALQLPRRDTALAFGVIDDPDAQDQRVVTFNPDVDGNMAVYGTGGAGKSAFLRTIAVSAGLTVRSGPCMVYGLDFGSRGLTMLEALPHVGSIIAGDDHERIGRLIRQLRETIDERAVRYAAVQAGTIGEYRAAANQPDEPRVILLLDGIGAFRAAYESSAQSEYFDMLQAIALDGRQVGVHLVLSADRAAAVPMALASSIQRHLVLRLSSENDLMALNAPRDGFPEQTPPGRGYLEDAEVQVAVFGGSAGIADQSAAIERLARRLSKEGRTPAPEVERLSEQVQLSALPVSVGTPASPALGIEDESLLPIGFDPATPLLIAGPSGSGRSTVVRTVVESLQRYRPGVRFVLFAPRRSDLAGYPLWDRVAQGPDEAAELAGELSEQVESEQFGDSTVIVVEAIGEFLNSSADYPLGDLLKAARTAGVTIVAEGETSTLGGSWPLLAVLKGGRHGIILQPDQMDGDSLFQTPIGRVKRAEFPPGRGMYVRSGRAARVQVAQP